MALLLEHSVRALRLVTLFSFIQTDTLPTHRDRPSDCTPFSPLCLLRPV